MSSKDLVSIDLGSDSIKVVIGSDDKKYLRKNVFTFNTPLNAVVNGDIVDGNALGAAFESVISKYKL